MSGRPLCLCQVSTGQWSKCKENISGRFSEQKQQIWVKNRRCFTMVLRWRSFQQMAQLLSSVPAAVEMLLVSNWSCNIQPSSTHHTSWSHLFMKLQRKAGKNVQPKWMILSVVAYFCAVCVSGHKDCLELLLSYGAHIDMELPVLGTPLYSACLARATACVETLLLSGKNKNLYCHRESGSGK